MTALGPGRPTGGGDRRADILAAARAAMSQEQAAAMLREFVTAALPA